MKLKLLTLLFIFAPAMPAPAQENAFLGKWDITATAPEGKRIYWLEVKNDGDHLAGWFLNRGGSVFRLPAITMQNGELQFSLPNSKQVFTAKAEGGKLVGRITSDKEPINWVGVRPPNWGSYDADARHKFGKPIELFDGKSLDAWGVEHQGQPSGWTVEDGVMVNSAHANNLVSKQRFKDFKVHAEYKLEKDSNSGIYLRGRYELQVLDDYGKDPESHGHMAIYSRLAPRVNASKPAGEWQTVDATIVGNRVTVVLNGQTVHDNAILEGITGGALDSDEAADGPLMIQGDHGRIWLRKVTVTPIVK
jgi:3-keto-disaccharide hydrolase